MAKGMAAHQEAPVTGAAAPPPCPPMFVMPPHPPFLSPHPPHLPESSAEDMAMHTSVRCIKNTGALIFVHDVEEMKISGELMQHAAKAGVLPAAGAADSEPGEAAASRLPHARREQRASQDTTDTIDIEASSNSGSIIVLCNVRHVVMG